MATGSWPIWFLVACCIAALVLVIIAAVKSISAAMSVQRHAKAIAPEELLIKVAMAREAGTRIEGSLGMIEALLPRAQSALTRINSGIRAIKSIVPGR
jgi:hypothetical protein